MLTPVHRQLARTRGGVSLFLPICKSCRFSDGPLTQPQHEWSRKQTEHVKKTQHSSSNVTYQWFLLTHHSTFKPWQSKEFFGLIMQHGCNCTKNYIMRWLNWFAMIYIFNLPYFFLLILLTWCYLNFFSQFFFFVQCLLYILYCCMHKNIYQIDFCHLISDWIWNWPTLK